MIIRLSLTRLRLQTLFVLVMVVIVPSAGCSSGLGAPPTDSEAFGPGEPAGPTSNEVPDEGTTAEGFEEDKVFAHDLLRPTTAEIIVRDDSGPLSGVTVNIMGPPRPGAACRGLLWRGVTDPDGRAVALFAPTTDLGEVGLILNKRGYVGPHTDEEQQTQLGHFAPSSWQTIAITALDEGLTVYLTRRDY